MDVHTSRGSGGGGGKKLDHGVSKNFDRHSSLARPCILNGRTYLGEISM